MNPDFYLDERPANMEGGGNGSAATPPAWNTPGGSGPAWESGGAKEDRPEWVYKELSAQVDYGVLRSSAGGRLMHDDRFGLIHCAQRCPYIPAVLVNIKGENEEISAGSHSRCVLIRLEYRDICGRYVYDDVPLDAVGFDGEWKKNDGETVAWFGGFPLCELEEKIDVNVRWQGGHFNHAEIRKMRIFIFGFDLGWQVVPLNRWKRFATITVDETFHVRVNGFEAKLAGNRRKLLNDAEH